MWSNLFCPSLSAKWAGIMMEKIRWSKWSTKYTYISMFQLLIMHFVITFRLLRPEVLLASVLWEDTAVITHAKNFLHNFLTNNKTVLPANLREVPKKRHKAISELNLLTQIPFAGHLHRCCLIWRIYILAILLGTIHIFTWLPRWHYRTITTVASLRQNQRCLVSSE